MNRPEQALQRAVVQYLNLYPPPPAGPYWTAVNPVPGKTKVAAAISKALGMKPGVPDLVLCWRGRFIGIELKAAKGRLSKAQDAAISELQLAGGAVLVVRSVEQLADELGVLQIPGPRVMA